MVKELECDELFEVLVLGRALESFLLLAMSTLPMQPTSTQLRSVPEAFAADLRVCAAPR